MASKKSRTFPYSAVETILGEVFNIEPGSMKSFKAKIRHLRNIDVPRGLPRPGSGHSIEYSFDQILQVAFAMALELHGITPRVAASWGPSMLESFKTVSIMERPPGDIYFISIRELWEMELSKIPGGPSEGFTLVSGFEELTETIKSVFSSEHTLLIIDMSGLVREIEELALAVCPT
jgi:hypothetical protein